VSHVYPCVVHFWSRIALQNVQDYFLSTALLLSLTSSLLSLSLSLSLSPLHPFYSIPHPQMIRASRWVACMAIEVGSRRNGIRQWRQWACQQVYAETNQSMYVDVSPCKSMYTGPPGCRRGNLSERGRGAWPHFAKRPTMVGVRYMLGRNATLKGSW
jgi:hypothetical protein